MRVERANLSRVRQMARQRVQAGVARAAGLPHALLHHQPHLPLRPLRGAPKVSQFCSQQLPTHFGINSFVGNTFTMARVLSVNLTDCKFQFKHF